MQVSDIYPANLNAALDAAMAWMLGRMTSNDSQFKGSAVPTETTAELIEGAIDLAGPAEMGAYWSNYAQTRIENIVLDPLTSNASLDLSKGPDGFPINYSPDSLLSNNLLVNLIQISAATTINGRTLNLDSTKQLSYYRVDVYSATDTLYYHGSAGLNADGTWSVANVGAGAVIAFLMPSASAQPAPGSYTQQVAGWIAHTNMGVGAKLTNYFVRLFSKTDIEYLQEDNIPLIVQDDVHARFGSSRIVGAGTPVAHVIYNDPVYGELDLYSTLQEDAVFSDLPRSMEIDPGDPDYLGAGQITASTGAALENRCWIYSAALAIAAFTLGGLWDTASRIIARLNDLRENPGYLPSQVLEDAEDGSTSRWTLASGAGSVTNAFDSSEPPASSGGSNVIEFTATTAPAQWNYSGSGLPDTLDSIVQWKFKSAVDFAFTIGATTSTGKVTSFIFATQGTAGYDSAAKSVTLILPLNSGMWQTETQDLNSLLAQYIAGEMLDTIAAFSVQLEAAGLLSIDNLSLGAPQPAGSLSFSYDVYNGQVDQAYIRAGANAWVAYAYGIYMEHSSDYERGALGLAALIQFLLSLVSTSSDLRGGLVTLGWGKYQDPGYVYVPGEILSCSVEHNIDCYFAFTKAAGILPLAAQTLLAKGLITAAQYNSLASTSAQAASAAATIAANLITICYTAPTAAAWQANYTYQLGDQITDPGGDPQKCVVAGTSGASAPGFNGTLGGTTADGTATWQQTGHIGDVGHFAQGVDHSGITLDVSESVDSNGTWAAMFADAYGRDDVAAECLKFAYERFFLTNQTIQLSTNPDSYSGYQQLTPFDGFKFYNDDAGGYSSSPLSISAEMTWGAISAYLRMEGNAALQSYFASQNYPGGLDGFINDLVQSMETMRETTGDGLLAYSLADRPLPWEFDVRKHMAATAWFWITSDRNDILFSGSSQGLGRRPYLQIPQGVQQSVRQLDGQSSIGALELEVVDVRGYATQLVSGGKLEGRKASLRVGYPGMNSTDFVTIATQQIDHVNVLPDTTGFKLECTDLKRSAKTKIYLNGDDGLPIGKKHPRTITANPMDVALMILQNELGVGQSDLVPQNAWRIYDPAQWDATNTSNPTLLYPNPLVDVDMFLSYRNGIFAGYLFEFTLTQSVEAKQFLEFEIYKALGGYWITLADGRVSPRFFFPPYTFMNLASLDQRTLTALPVVTRNPIINQVTYRLDYDGSGFQTELNFAYAPSLQQFDLQGIQIIESKGIRTERGGISLAGLTANRIFRRYGGIDPVSNKATGGAPIYKVESQFMTLGIEAGDFIYLSHPQLPDFETGKRGVFNRIVEVIQKQPDYTKGKMSYELLDTGWMATKNESLAAPAGTADCASATANQKTQYMFLSDAATDEYSDGTAGKTVW